MHFHATEILASIALRRAYRVVSKNVSSSLQLMLNAYRDFTGVAFSHSPEQVVGKGVFTEVGQDLVVNLKSRDVGCTIDR